MIFVDKEGMMSHAVSFSVFLKPWRTMPLPELARFIHVLGVTGVELPIRPGFQMVNLKNAFWRRVTGPEAADVTWQPYWTSGRQGLASWPRVAQILMQRSYAGVVCLTAEYSDETDVARLIAEDVAYARSLWA